VDPKSEKGNGKFQENRELIPRWYEIGFETQAIILLFSFSLQENSPSSVQEGDAKCPFLMTSRE